ncbi:MAG: hypothetical protein K0S74_1881 [Chlamydiales bacterium]|jgi:hypothetical protein|nr:hypothetical protein [Chlamydiales bacterium]
MLESNSSNKAQSQYLSKSFSETSTTQPSSNPRPFQKSLSLSSLLSTFKSLGAGDNRTPSQVNKQYSYQKVSSDPLSACFQNVVTVENIVESIRTLSQSSLTLAESLIEIVNLIERGSVNINSLYLYLFLDESQKEPIDVMVAELKKLTLKIDPHLLKYTSCCKVVINWKSLEAITNLPWITKIKPIPTSSWQTISNEK